MYMGEDEEMYVAEDEEGDVVLCVSRNTCGNISFSQSMLPCLIGIVTLITETLTKINPTDA